MGGKLLVIAGLLIGILAGSLAGSPWVAFATTAVVWVAFSRKYVGRFAGEEDEGLPTLYWLPMWLWALPMFGLAALTYHIDRTETIHLPVRDRLDHDSAQLATGDAGDNPELASRIMDQVNASAPLTSLHARSRALLRIKAGAVLALVQVPRSNDLSDESRHEILTIVERVVRSSPEKSSTRLFIGLRNEFTYNAAMCPGAPQVNEVLAEDELMKFYAVPKASGRAKI